MKIAVFVVLAIHGIGLLALLMQGCKKSPEAAPPLATEDTNAPAPPAFVEPTNTPPPFTAPVVAATNTMPPVEPITQPSVVQPSALAPTEYKVVQGDTYTSLARKFNTTTRALKEANPGVDPTRLQIGQTLHVPPPSPAAPSTTGATTTAVGDLATGEQVYSVQSGDTLTKIAEKFKVTIKALRSANSLTTDRIKVGQKLKIPVKSAPAPTAPTTPTGGGTVPAQ
ncbi:MAG TPA: LysM peptidoglycan-binding domain-containing protein [Verrucomicrobiae bacterium]